MVRDGDISPVTPLSPNDLIYRAHGFAGHMSNGQREQHQFNVAGMSMLMFAFEGEANQDA
jgi:hypothetical protein